jgi:hypothetical protein
MSVSPTWGTRDRVACVTEFLYARPLVSAGLALIIGVAHRLH